MILFAAAGRTAISVILKLTMIKQSPRKNPEAPFRGEIFMKKFFYQRIKLLR